MQKRKMVARDVFVKNECLSFERTRAVQLVRTVPELAALCIISTELQLPRDMKLLDEACAVEAQPLLFSHPRRDQDYRLWLFAAHGPWQSKSVMVKHRKLWDSFPSAWSLADFRLNDEIMIESDEGIRFAGVAEISPAGLFVATQILRQESACAMILSKRTDVHSEDGISDLFNSAFPLQHGTAQTQVDWLSLALHRCPLEDIVIRVGGSWDEREASLDLIMLPEKLPDFNL